jgi:hypothetical protein
MPAGVGAAMKEGYHTAHLHRREHHDYCRRRGWRIVGEYTDALAESGVGDQTIMGIAGRVKTLARDGHTVR